jgi:acyl carrier protein
VDGDVAARIHTALEEAFGLEVTSETSLYDDVAADSLTIMELIGALEDDLGIALPESTEFALSIRTVGDLVAAFTSRSDRVATGPGG